MKIFGFKEKKKKLSGSAFRNIVANSIIGFVLLSMFALTYVGGTLKAFSQADETPIYNGNLNSNKICLMINVYWGNEYLDSMLETLNSNNVKTTFFLGGMWVEKYPELAKKIYENGHEIANHGYFHKDQDKINLDGNKKEISSCHNIVKTTLGVEMNLFAPPSGAFNSSTMQAAKALNYNVIMWTRDTIDWRDQDADTIYTRATKNAKGGDLILMHPTKCTAEALPGIIKTLQENGFTLTTVTECLS